MKPANIVFMHFLTKLSGVSYTLTEICPVVKNDVSVGLRHACTLHNPYVSDRMRKSVLLQWTSSLNYHNIFKGSCTDLKVDAAHQ